MKQTLITGEPLDIVDMIMLTGKDALADMDGHKVHILSASEGQAVECDEVLTWGGHLWGLRKLPSDKKRRYDYMAYIVVE